MQVVEIDVSLCSGHGRCYVLSPSLFADDESGFGQVRGSGEVTPQTRQDAERAVRACPERAVALKAAVGHNSGSAERGAGDGD